MRKTFKKSEYFLAALLGLVAAFPLVVEQPTLPVSAMDASVIGTSIQQKALDNYGNYRDNRRGYAKAKALCIELRSKGEKVDCPDINNRADILHFLKTHTNLKPAATATGSTKTVLHLSDLSEYDLNLMRRYMRINSCPVTMKDHLPGFYNLCLSLLDPDPPLYQGIRNPKSTGVLSDTPQFSLDDFIKAHQDAHFNR